MVDPEHRMPRYSILTVSGKMDAALKHLSYAVYPEPHMTVFEGPPSPEDGAEPERGKEEP